MNIHPANGLLPVGHGPGGISKGRRLHRVEAVAPQRGKVKLRFVLGKLQSVAVRHLRKEAGVGEINALKVRPHFGNIRQRPPCFPGGKIESDDAAVSRIGDVGKAAPVIDADVVEIRVRQDDRRRKGIGSGDFPGRGIHTAKFRRRGVGVLPRQLRRVQHPKRPRLVRHNALHVHQRRVLQNGLRRAPDHLRHLKIRMIFPCGIADEDAPRRRHRHPRPLIR